MKEQSGIKIDYSRDEQFTESGRRRLKEGYMPDHEKSPQERFAAVSRAFSSNPAHAQRLYDYSSKFWFCYSSPQLAYGKTARGLPISCFSSFLEDSLKGLMGTSEETRMMSVLGGGVGLHVGLRPADSSKSSGIIPHLKTYDADTLAYRQGATRRAAVAAYLDVSHPEIVDFVAMRTPTGGDVNRKCLNLHHGVNLSDDFMQRVWDLSVNDKGLNTKELQERDKWNLIDPHTKEIRGTVSVKEFWSMFLGVRVEQGEPYCWYIDTVNRALPDFQKAKGLRNNGGNLCAEITLATDALRSFVCCIAPLNLEKWDEWKDDPLFISDVVEMLDNALEVFIEEASQYPQMEKAVYSAKQERSLGIGAMGWHALLQSKGLDFESALAVSLNKKIWAHIKEKAVKASERLGMERGVCLDSVFDVLFTDEDPYKHYTHSYKQRNAHLLALAPTASTSYFINTSPGGDPYLANAYTEKGVNGVVVHKNKHLASMLTEMGKNTDEVWSSILAHKGSVQHLTFLSEQQKRVFKTAAEIDQRWILQHAADRQKFICQSQSTNLFVNPNISAKELSDLHLLAWKMGLKSLYYCRSEAAMGADAVGKKVERVRIEDLVRDDGEVCLACQ